LNYTRKTPGCPAIPQSDGATIHGRMVGNEYRVYLLRVLGKEGEKVPGLFTASVVVKKMRKTDPVLRRGECGPAVESVLVAAYIDVV